ncbi:hypothetical protein [Nocardioides bruguierae]|uniref:Uncharacterized protein n=1 Tax=Nocardioides bruguierae TaxID=2945102 RepID=A0A9X2ID29_9ACTN|nr:hypothetical protein [Nocardioides bruguierae]MCL8024908.1 hypothetical protein [Nocardioides bruguierae]MCM0619311.1 hypothetical protein [Nocardioides bruguierae]
MTARTTDDAAGAAGAVTCDFCGTVETDQARALTWSLSVERGQRRTYCPACSREHLRAIESKLDSRWW